MIDMALVFDTETIRLMALFENLTGVPVKDCIISEDTVYFIVEEGKVAIAIGKNGCKVRNVEKMIGKTVKLFEYSKDLTNFVKKLMPQVNEIRIKNEDKKVTVEVKVDKKSKALVIGRNGKNIKIIKEILKRNHKVSDLIVR